MTILSKISLALLLQEGQCVLMTFRHLRKQYDIFMAPKNIYFPAFYRLFASKQKIHCHEKIYIAIQEYFIASRNINFSAFYRLFAWDGKQKKNTAKKADTFRIILVYFQFQDRIPTALILYFVCDPVYRNEKFGDNTNPWCIIHYLTN